MSKDNTTNIVKQVCKELGITQKELAELMGVAEQTIRGWSSNKEMPKWGENFMQTIIKNSKNEKTLEVLREALKGIFTTK